MQIRKFRFILISLGLALLLLAGLVFFVDRQVQESVPGQVPASSLSAADRLLQPTLPSVPSQADLGSQAYWLHCLPCHGDRGQGLTDEFRATYPPEDQNCWQSGCHGKRPYEDGFTLPQVIPAVIGNGTLWKFTDALQLHSYIRTAMPFWKPGSLTEDDSWSITAFVLRENGLWKGDVKLNEANAADVKIKRLSPEQLQVRERSVMVSWWIVLGAALTLIILFFILIKNQNKAKIEREAL